MCVLAAAVFSGCWRDKSKYNSPDRTFTYDSKIITLISDNFRTETSYEVSFSSNTMYWDAKSKKLEYKKS